MCCFLSYTMIPSSDEPDGMYYTEIAAPVPLILGILALSYTILALIQNRRHQQQAQEQQRRLERQEYSSSAPAIPLMEERELSQSEQARELVELVRGEQPMRL